MISALEVEHKYNKVKPTLNNPYTMSKVYINTEIHGTLHKSIKCIHTLCLGLYKCFGVYKLGFRMHKCTVHSVAQYMYIVFFTLQPGLSRSFFTLKVLVTTIEA